VVGSLLVRTVQVIIAGLRAGERDSCSWLGQPGQGLPHRCGERRGLWQGLLAARQGVAKHGCGIGEPAGGKVGVRQVSAAGEGVGVIGAENLLVVGAGLLVQL
jgi:hypothetical protein